MTSSPLKQRLKKLRAGQKGAPSATVPVIALPLVAYYGGDEEFMRRRAAFYTAMARVFSFEGWKFDKYENELAAAIGFGGRGRSVLPIDQRHTAFVNEHAAPFEWLISRRMLETKKDRPGAHMVRFAVGLRFREEFEGSQMSPLKGQSIDAPSAGSGGPGNTFSDYKLDCMNQVEAVKAALSRRDYQILVDVLCNDRWIWDGCDHKERKVIILRLHKILDRAGWALGYITGLEYEERWSTAAQRA